MQLIQGAKTFLESEDGATSVDWIVISGIAFGLVIAITLTMGAAISDESKLVGDFVKLRPVGTY